MKAETQKWLDSHPEEAEALRVFTEHMADEMMANSQKGSRADWQARNPRDAIAEVHWHAAKLAVSLKDLEKGDDSEVIQRTVMEFSADVGVCSMMLADCARVLMIGATTKIGGIEHVH